MKLGKIIIDHPLILAPMENVTDLPFRLMMKRLGADMVYTEFTSAEALIRDIPKADQKIRILKNEHPVGIQIFGGNPESVARAVEKISLAHPDFIDINAGCWSRSHVSRGECAALLQDIPRFASVVKAAVRSTRIPVTVKTRLGWDQQNIVIEDVAKMVEECGAQALTVHCRTRNQAYKGKADWSWLEKVRKATSLALIGNGDVKTPHDAIRLFDMGCDGVMIGREAVSNPWIFQDIKVFLQTGVVVPERDIKEKIKICVEHLDLTLKYKGIRGLIPFRKFYAGYLRNVHAGAKFRSYLMTLSDAREIKNALRDFQRTARKSIT